MMVEPPMLLPLQDFPRNLGQQSGCSLPGSLWWLCMFQAETWGSGWCCLNFLLKHLTFLRLLWCSVYNARLIYCLMPRNKIGLWAASMDKHGQERTVLVCRLLWNWTLMDSGLFLSDQWIWTFFASNPRKGSPAHGGGTFSPTSMNQVDPALGHWHGSWSI